MPEDGGQPPAEGPGDARGRQPSERRRFWLRGLPWDVVGVVALGGVIGAVARFGMEVAWSTGAGSFPWVTFTVNVTGCALIGVLMVLATEVWPARRLVRPFAGAGLLGGFTTFSAYTVEIERLVAGGATPMALLYLLATPLAAVVAVWLTAVLTRGVLRRVTR